MSFTQEDEALQSREIPSDRLKAKRKGPPRIKPVVTGNMRFQVIHRGIERGLKQNGGYIAAFDISSGKELWVLKIYDITYDQDTERDVQDKFIISMTKGLFSGKIHIKDESGRKFIVDPEKRNVVSK